MSSLPKPIKQKASQGGRVMRQERQEASLKETKNPYKMKEKKEMPSSAKKGSMKNMGY